MARPKSVAKAKAALEAPQQTEEAATSSRGRDDNGRSRRIAALKSGKRRAEEEANNHTESQRPSKKAKVEQEAPASQHAADPPKERGRQVVESAKEDASAPKKPGRKTAEPISKPVQQEALSSKQPGRKAAPKPTQKETPAPKKPTDSNTSESASKFHPKEAPAPKKREPKAPVHVSKLTPRGPLLKEKAPAPNEHVPKPVQKETPAPKKPDSKASEPAPKFHPKEAPAPKKREPEAPVHVSKFTPREALLKEKAPAPKEHVRTAAEPASGPANRFTLRREEFPLTRKDLDAAIELRLKFLKSAAKPMGIGPGPVVEKTLAPEERYHSSNVTKAVSVPAVKNLAFTRECTVCTDDLPVAKFVALDGCGHKQDTCVKCLENWIDSQVDSHASKFTCPTTGCHHELSESDLLDKISMDVFDRFDEYMARKSLRESGDFYECIREGCEAGGFTDEDNNIVTCYACGLCMCKTHNMPFHEGQTCDEYEQQKKLSEEDVATIKTIQNTTKPCPKCKANVEKRGGCDHMTCKCGGEFCYFCGADYAGQDGIRNKGNSAHKESCRHYSTAPRHPAYRPHVPRGGLYPPYMPLAATLHTPLLRSELRGPPANEPNPGGGTSAQSGHDRTTQLVKRKMDTNRLKRQPTHRDNRDANAEE